MPTAMATANSVRMPLNTPMLREVVSLKLAMEPALSNTALINGARLTAAQKSAMASGSTRSAASATPAPSLASPFMACRFMKACLPIRVCTMSTTSTVVRVWLQRRNSTSTRSPTRAPTALASRDDITRPLAGSATGPRASSTERMSSAPSTKPISAASSLCPRKRTRTGSLR